MGTFAALKMLIRGFLVNASLDSFANANVMSRDAVIGNLQFALASGD